MSSVNRPTDTKAKEADVNRKLQFYGIASGKFIQLIFQETIADDFPLVAFQAGKVPSVSIRDPNFQPRHESIDRATLTESRSECE